MPQAPENETRVSSKYWTDDSTTRLRDKSPSTSGKKRTAPECGDSADQAAEELRRKHLRTFDFIPALENVVEVKDEPASTQPPSEPPRPQSIAASSSSIEPLHPAAVVQPVLSAVPVNLTSSTTPAKSSSPKPKVRPACSPSGSEASFQPQRSTRPRSLREEQAVISALAHVCDQSVTEATINLVLRWGRGAPNPSGEVDDLGIAYLAGIMARVDNHGIDPDRRMAIVDLLCSKFTRHLEDLKTRIGTLSTPQLPVPSSPNLDQSVRPGGSATESDRRTHVSSARPLVPQDNDGHTAQGDLRYRLERQMNSAHNVDPEHDTQPSTAKSFASTTAVATSKKAAALPKQPFDVFQDAALAARNFTTEEKGGLPEFQMHIKSIWRRVPGCQRDEWQELLRIRKTCTHVSAKSRELLESQGFLKHFVPDYHLHTHDSQLCGTGALAAGSTGPIAENEQIITPSMHKCPKQLPFDLANYPNRASTTPTHSRLKRTSQPASFRAIPVGYSDIEGHWHFPDDARCACQLNFARPHGS